MMTATSGGSPGCHYSGGGGGEATKARYPARATVTTPTVAAPASRRTRAQAPAVAPVVMMSSTRTTCRPATSPGRCAWKAPSTLSRRAAAPSAVWGAVAMRRVSTSPRAVTCHATPPRRAGSPDWVKASSPPPPAGGEEPGRFEASPRLARRVQRHGDDDVQRREREAGAKLGDEIAQRR